MAGRDEIVAYANGLLDVDHWPEYGPPGLQVIGSADVHQLACGVSASLELFDRAAALGANMILVHHGLFWRNEPVAVDQRMRGRLETLFRSDMSLVAYHLALDAHPELGNNARLAAEIGALREGTFGDVGAACRFAAPVSVSVLADLVAAVVGREPLVLESGSSRAIERVAISTGAAGFDLIRAAHEGFDAFVTGEPEEPSRATARELGIHLIAAGHHASERLGVQALTAHLAERFSVRWDYVEIDNPV